MTGPVPITEVRWFQQSEALLSLAMIGVLFVMIVPVPAIILDMGLATSIALTLVLLVVSINARSALELSAFPSVLLLLTLFRLALNVATTRLILLEGSGGKIVEAFGRVVIGGNLVVGLVIFLILVIIQFVVITKGASRVSEVAARFTLDALPGKQMAIDAELNAGSISDAEARRRRELLARETDFFGAMDGASKFVRGDAVAGLMITAINLLGGVASGVINGLSIVESIRLYSVLSVGDGLVSQIPALIVATASGILVTKSGSAQNLGEELGEQLNLQSRSLRLGALLVGALALAPGLPKWPFLLLSGGMFWWLRSIQRPKTVSPTASADEAAPDPGKDSIHLQDFLATDRSVIEVGARLIPLVIQKREKGIAAQITSLRQEFARTQGVWIPQIRITNNTELDPEEYRVLIAGREVGRSTLRLAHWLALAPPEGDVVLPGEPTREPAFGLKAKWIQEELRRQAEALGYTVVDPINVLITHLGELLKQHGHELISREDLKTMLETVRQFAPTVVDELKPDIIRMSVLHQVLVLLAAERIPLTELVLILESIANHAVTLKGAEDLADRVREDLGRVVCERRRDLRGVICSVMLDPVLEQRLRDSTKDRKVVLPPKALEQFIRKTQQTLRTAALKHQLVSLVVDQSLRRPVRKLLLREIPDVTVLGYQEVPQEQRVETVSVIRGEEVFESPTSPEVALTGVSRLAA
jgi:flagellar biosynthesis protein FlhA